ncbi:antibiotic biosynthesis monooxygenase [Mesorhizobium sp. CAU 1732]|uniref:putative quinol monooxygenase n=1 Tax=Mesorhizobium sp. CAU 1732 TaxID=3140358 RepID=UPI003260A12D
MAHTASSPLVRMAELEIDPAQLEAYTALLKTEIEASIAMEPGVLMLHAVSLKDQPCHLRIMEVYADQNAYEAHLRSPHFMTYKSATSSMVKALRLIETEPVALRARGNIPLVT